MNSLVILSERKAVARANTLQRWLQLESARARTVTADEHLLYESLAELLYLTSFTSTGRAGVASLQSTNRDSSGHDDTRDGAIARATGTAACAPEICVYVERSKQYEP